MPKFLKEPFVHFVLLGGLLFAAHFLWQKHVVKADRTIHISPAEIERQAQIFTTENRRQPSEADLEGLLFAHIEERSFEHIYLSPKGRSETVTLDAEKLLAAGPTEDWESQGDAFMTGRSFNRLAQPAVQRDFGTGFAQDLFSLPDTRDWQGPINSAFGVHLVRLTTVTPENLPAFKDIQIEVEAVWLDDAKREENLENLKELIGKYRVEVDE